jgi:hypothetical protein
MFGGRGEGRETYTYGALSKEVFDICWCATRAERIRMGGVRMRVAKWRCFCAWGWGGIVVFEKKQSKFWFLGLLYC